MKIRRDWEYPDAPGMRRGLMVDDLVERAARHPGPWPGELYRESGQDWFRYMALLLQHGFVVRREGLDG